MIAIETRFIGPTNHRSARVVASCCEQAVDSSGNKRRKLTLPWDHALNSEDNHRAIARALIAKLGWFHDSERGDTYGDWYAGGTERGYVFVCALGYAKVKP